MAIPVIMPRQGQSVESCIITKWHKQPGDSVAVGDILFSYETDKAAFDEESKVNGTLLGLFFQEGDDVPCLLNVCAIGAPGESFSDLDPNAGAAPAEEKPVQAEAAPQQAAAPIAAPAVTAAPIDGQMKISPRAKQMAETRHADLSRAQATGPDGRVIARDVQALLDQGLISTPAASIGNAGGIAGTGLGGRVTLNDLNQPTASMPAAPIDVQHVDSYEEPLSNMRKVIAKAMTQSLNNMAQLTHNLSFDTTQIQAVRKQFKEQGAAFGMEKITLNDIILFAVSRTLMMPEHRALNANLLGDTMKYFNAVNLGLAVDTERGLIVPVLFGADKMSLLELSNESKRLAKECQSGKINPDYLSGGSFTVSNLGSLGIETFTPVINPPQTGILGVNTITTKIKMVGGEIVPYPSMSLSLTYDHRALDGAPASRFLRDLGSNLENFTLLLAKG
ncbi:2-oxo acid dehydrogenase subunit E2 [Eubacteriales bacterium OttesenSCG-928-N13]|nr:2-oxo acid dehydrogenase subunit E2 [Eubacteriales bacterium OttesenSCG-928-N13]